MTIFENEALGSKVKKYAKNVSWVLLEKITRMTAGLFVGLYVARFLGPEQFGILNFVVSYSSVFSELARCGLESIVVRDLVKGSALDKAKILASAFYAKIFAGIVATTLILGTFLIAKFTPNEKTYIAIISIGFIFQGAEVVDYYFQAEVKSKFISICRLWQLVISSIAKLASVFLHADLIWFVAITLLDQVTLSLLLLYIYRKVGPGDFFGSFALQKAKQLLNDSWPILASSVAIIFYMRLDQIMLKAMLGDVQVGLFSASMRISEIWLFIPMAISSTLLPSIVAAHKESPEKFTRRAQSLFDLMTWICIPPIIVISLASQEIVNLLYGPAFENAADVLVITIWAGLPITLGVARSSWMLAQGLQRISSLYVMIGAATKIVLNFALIPRYGIVGAGIATLISQLSVAFVAPLIFPQSRPSVGMFLNSINLPSSLTRLAKGEWR